VYEFSSFRKFLGCIHKLSVGYTLEEQDRKAMLKFPWFYGPKTKLFDALKHPAIRTSYTRQDCSSAVERLGVALGTSIVCAASGATVIESVNMDWLEKDRIQLFSMEQLKLMITSSDLQADFAERLQKVLSGLCFGGCEP
jgi:hypothetical protein